MPAVETVAGRIDVEELGLTLIHEHFFSSDEAVTVQWPHVRQHEPGVNERIEKVHRAVARASARTGAPIMAHSRPASNTGPRQVGVFLEEGVAPEKIQIAHTGDTDDLDYIERLLEAGVYIGMDRYGLEIFLPMEKRNATVTERSEEHTSE